MKNVINLACRKFAQIMFYENCRKPHLTKIIPDDVYENSEKPQALIYTMVPKSYVHQNFFKKSTEQSKI